MLGLKKEWCHSNNGKISLRDQIHVKYPNIVVVLGHLESITVYEMCQVQTTAWEN